MAVRIRNVKTERSERQIEKEWAELSAFKQRLLESSDWTQLADANIKNIKEVQDWRQHIRKLNIRQDFNNPKTAEKYLRECEESFPKIEYGINESPNKTEDNSDVEKLFGTIGELEKNLARLEAQIKNPTTEEKIENVDIEFAHGVLLDNLKNDKNQQLIDAGSLEYPLISTKMEQAADFLSRENQLPLSEYSLLKNNSEETDTDYAETVLYECRSYFKNLHNVERNYLHQIESVYNMSTDEINNWFESNGYRYRCSN